MPIAVGDAETGALALLPPAPLPPVVAAAPLPPAVAPAPPPPTLGPSGSSDFGARGLPQEGVGPVGPIVSPVIIPEPVPPSAPVAPEPVPTASSPSGAGDIGGARGMPQVNIGPVGTIVEPHGAPSPGAGGGTTATTSGGDTGGGSTRTIESAFVSGKVDPNDHRAASATAWLRFQEFFGSELPHFAGQVTNLRLSLPKVVG